MERIHMFSFKTLIFVALVKLTCCSVKKYDLHMPNVHPDRDELYLCTPVKIVSNTSLYIVGFEPHATMNVAHHMLVFGCATPGTEDQYWDCGEMAVSDSNSQLKRASPCAEASHVIYAWARNAKALQLPQDVGFRVGEGTDIKYIVLQIHYSKKFPGDQRDNSGLFLLYTEESQKKLAGVLLLAVGGFIPPKSITHMETACQITENKTIYPIAYRTHTHTLGRVVTGYNVRRDAYGKDHWRLLGKRDPMTPQMFYPVFDSRPIKPGDKLTARCTMDSRERDRTTQVGPTNADEMCNFYLIYYVDNVNPLEMKYCTTQGPPYYHWTNGEPDLNNIPNEEASSLY